MFGRKCSRQLFAMIVAAMAISPMQAQAMSFFRQFTTPGINRAIAVAADASDIYVIGTRPTPEGLTRAGVRKYDSRGNELWTREFSDPALRNVRAAADATGVYVVSGEPCLLRRYSHTGNELWTRELGFPGLCGVAADVTGVYVSGRDSPPDFTS